jgi:hypothetical protein
MQLGSRPKAPDLERGLSFEVSVAARPPACVSDVFGNDVGEDARKLLRCIPHVEGAAAACNPDRGPEQSDDAGQGRRGGLDQFLKRVVRGPHQAVDVVSCSVLAVSHRGRPVFGDGGEDGVGFTDGAGDRRDRPGRRGGACECPSWRLWNREPGGLSSPCS